MFFTFIFVWINLLFQLTKFYKKMGIFSFLGNFIGTKIKTTRMQVAVAGNIVEDFEKLITWEVYNNKIVCNMILGQKIIFDVEKAPQAYYNPLDKLLYGEKHQNYLITTPQRLLEGCYEIMVCSKYISVEYKGETWYYR